MMKKCQLENQYQQTNSSSQMEVAEFHVIPSIGKIVWTVIINNLSYF